MAAARTASLDKMVTLVAVLVEKSRGEDNCIHLSQDSGQDFVPRAVVQISDSGLPVERLPKLKGNVRVEGDWMKQVRTVTTFC